MEKEYFIGLDMGTNSVGWAVTDANYRLLRRKGKDMWGVRLFQEAQTAADRRMHRTGRRRLRREKVRIGYLREYFAEAICDVDPGFYQRLEDSKFFAEDKRVCQSNALFFDKNFTDKDYYKLYPTIFHLRKELLNNPEEHDVRLVYLAILNLFKHRGHFLNTALSGDGVRNLDDLYELFVSDAKRLLDLDVKNDGDTLWLENILSSKQYSNSGKLDQIISVCDLNKRKDKKQVEIWKMICGLTGKLSTIFTDEKFDEEGEKFSVSFRDSTFDEKVIRMEELLSEDAFEFALLLKQIHDWGILANVMNGDGKQHTYLSEARVDIYEKHKDDLNLLKELYKQYAPDKYDNMFRIMRDNNYSAYVGSVNSKNHAERRGAKCNTDEFFKAIKKDIEQFPDCDEKTYVLEEIAKGAFLPKQITTANGVIPNQVHKSELTKILKNAEGYLPFLKEKDESGLTISERIIKIFEFQLPYYIGPLNPKVDETFDGSKYVWSRRKENGKIMPWNIQQRIDMEASAEEFISKMVNHCTYINGEKVLPKNSLLYEKYMVLNELNNLQLNGMRCTPALKQDIYNDLFRTGKKVTRTALVNYLKINKYIDANEEVSISGIDGDFTNRLSNYAKFKAIFETDILTYEQEQMAEQIIFWGTIYGDTKKLLRLKIQEAYGDKLTDEQIKRIVGCKFKDWGRLSKELLEIPGADVETGEIKTVISRMWEENYNLTELIAGSKFTYKAEIEERASSLEKTLSEVEYEDLDGLYISAPVKRMVWQTILILQEITNVMGYEPGKVFVEMARDTNAVKERTVSRKKKFTDLYKSCMDDGINWSERISSTEESEFRRKKLYLYYTQKGRCMYTGEIIKIEDLFNDNLYDIDHIYPRHFVKDDSIENNLVLVYKPANAHKSDTFPIEGNIRRCQKTMWTSLKEGGFITEEKYKRLIRAAEFTDDERVAFISRQIVETRQGTKTVTDLLKKTFGTSEIVYVKAGNVSFFRERYKLMKCRNINDFHHANDAYLNIVVGNVYYTKFTCDPYNFIKDYKKDPKKYNYHMYQIFEHNVTRGGKIAWKADDHSSIGTVKEMMKKNTPLVTMMSYEAHGGFAAQNVVSAANAAKAKGIGYVPIKSSDSRLEDVCKYGGYRDAKGSYFFLVEHTVKNQRVRTVETMYLYLKERLNTVEKLEEYCRIELGYTDPQIKYKKINMYSMIRVNGFPLYLTARSNDRLWVCNAAQLVVDAKYNEYIRKLEKITDKKSISFEKQGVTREMNMELYDALVNKHNNSIYAKRPNSVGEKLAKGQALFAELEMEKQLYVLNQILQLSQRINQGADLSGIGESSKTGVSSISKKISSCAECKLIHQSATGLYEAEVDLLTV